MAYVYLCVAYSLSTLEIFVYPYYSAWKPWNITNTQSSAADKDDDIAGDATKPEDREYLTKNKGT